MINNLFLTNMLWQPNWHRRQSQELKFVGSTPTRSTNGVIEHGLSRVNYHRRAQCVICGLVVGRPDIINKKQSNSHLFLNQKNLFDFYKKICYNIYVRKRKIQNKFFTYGGIVQRQDTDLSSLKQQVRILLPSPRNMRSASADKSPPLSGPLVYRLVRQPVTLERRVRFSHGPP